MCKWSRNTPLPANNHTPSGGWTDDDGYQDSISQPYLLNELLRILNAQLDGISPSSESSKLSGNSAEISSGRPGWRPSALARTGWKSINQDLKIARAIASRVSCIRRFNSILSSSDPRMWAMARCSVSEGIPTVIFWRSFFVTCPSPVVCLLRAMRTKFGFRYFSK